MRECATGTSRLKKKIV